ncbi:MAG: hypothetical protein ACLPWG_16755 [Steroidobacteraceae bacterium]
MGIEPKRTASAFNDKSACHLSIRNSGGPMIRALLAAGESVKAPSEAADAAAGNYCKSTLHLSISKAKQRSSV